MCVFDLLCLVQLNVKQRSSVASSLFSICGESE